ncbi:MAG TPA: hypothetical protein VGX76_13145 [Pirellulales bacterium]|jgi:hypothetical protein|nr:hypothetical protein [Pirellulales bacterium]
MELLRDVILEYRFPQSISIYSPTNAPITDSDLVQLESLDRLRVLAVPCAGVSDAGLIHLNGLVGIDELYLMESSVTDAGVADLQKALSKCEICR